jgi:hypothetical protein
VQTSKAAPSLARFNNRLWVAFVVNNSTDSVLLCSTADGQHWTDHTKVGETSKTALSLAAFHDRLWVAFVASDWNLRSNQLLICSSADGQTWTGPISVNGQTSRTAPSLAAFNNRLWVAFVANDGSNQLLICSSADGQTWTGPISVHGQLSKTAPSLAVFAGPFDDFTPHHHIDRLWVAFVANNSTDSVLLCSTHDGQTWTDNTRVGEGSQTAPSLAVRYHQMWIGFIANNASHEVLALWTLDGLDWYGPGLGNSDLPPSGQSSKIAPSLAFFEPNNPKSLGGASLFVAFVANDGSNQLLFNAFNGANWSGTFAI